MLNLRVSSKKQAKIKLALQGCAGSGKTYSALLLAYGLCGDWTKIAIIDSENGSADLYASLGNYNVLPLQDNFTPETYIEAIKICEEAKMEVIIIDSISQCWDNLLEYHANLQGNSFTNWQKITPRINAFMQKILQSPSHVICTMRCKQDYVLSEKNGKMIPEKVGLKAVMRDGIDYEFTIVFDINMKHQVIASKDRTALFVNKPEFIITPTTGQAILDWCNEGVSMEIVKSKINQARTIEELTTIYHAYPEWNIQLSSDFTTRRVQLQEAMKQPSINYQPNFTRYGNNAITARQN
ncbi:AAA family ATPase [uncultured Butyricimonas sp.]|uniref:AAA family ATPase n=1 Tax=uncultured Butyricimonas sp. TaxID=1268785 RepID=UPI0026DC522D|nr:AAA family ATPase [uncultured Butyricimonas sp.]